MELCEPPVDEFEDAHYDCGCHCDHASLCACAWGIGVGGGVSVSTVDVGVDVEVLFELPFEPQFEFECLIEFECETEQLLTLWAKVQCGSTWGAIMMAVITGRAA